MYILGFHSVAHFIHCRIKLDHNKLKILGFTKNSGLHIQRSIPGNTFEIPVNFDYRSTYTYYILHILYMYTLCALDCGIGVRHLLYKSITSNT